MSLPPPRRTALRRRLLAWYDVARRDLPWRFPQHGADPYRVWLSEAMLQQTQVARVLPYYRRFLERWPTLAALAAAEEEEVLAAWSGLGYYARARALLRTARTALARHGGLPRDLEALRALPGLGPYTAGAVASLAFAIPAPAVDGNVARVLSRLEVLDGDPAAASTVRATWDLAGALVDPVRPGDLNQALIELGATICTRRSPACPRCPVASLCRARAAGRERELPRVRRRAAQRPMTLACALLARDGAWLLVRRPAGGLFGGMWLPPCVEVPIDATPAEAGRALRGPLAALLAGRPRVGASLARVERILTHRALTLVAYRVEGGGALRPEAAVGARWVRPAAQDRLAVPAAARALLARLDPPST